jgi:hypothetical protein
MGIMMCAVHFAYEYSVLSLVSFTVLPSQSTSMLPFRHRQILSLFHGNMVAVSVSGALPAPSVVLHHECEACFLLAGTPVV